MSNSAEIGNAWLTGEAIPGVRFLLNDAVQIVRGVHAGMHGSVVSLIATWPTVTFIVETSRGEDVTVCQDDLAASTA